MAADVPSPRQQCRVMTLLDVLHPQLDELGSTSPDSRGDRVPLCPTPPAWWLRGVPAVPHQLTRREQALVPVWQNNGWVWSWDQAKQLHGFTATRNPRPLGSLSPSTVCRTWGCANMTEHSEMHTERKKCVCRSGFNAFLKLLQRRQH